MEKLLYSGGTTAFKVSVGCNKEEALVYSMVVTMDIKSYNGVSGDGVYGTFFIAGYNFIYHFWYHTYLHKFFCYVETIMENW